VVTSDAPLRAYMQINPSCTSTIKPTGVGTTYSGDGEGSTLGVSTDGCQWVYFADILYSSMKAYIPTQTYSPTSTITLNILSDYVAMLWNDRQYVAGQNGEKSPIEIRNHDTYYGEGATLNCAGPHCGRVILTTAPGESFADTLKPTDPLTGYDPTKGVSILINDPIRWPTTPDGLWVENNVDIIGLQIKSLHGGAVGNFTAGYDNGVTVRDCICEGGIFDNPYSTPAVISLDTQGVVANSLVIAHGPNAIVFKYPGLSLHNTIISPDGTGLGAIETGHRWYFNDTVVADTAIFGFAHAGATGDTSGGTAFDPTSANNATDAPVRDAGITVWAGNSPPGGPVVAIPGAVYGLSLAAAFMASGDYRPKPGGPLAGKGAAYGVFVSFCALGTAGCDLVNYSFDTPALIGTPRPGVGGYDIGAFQTP
jgi:hypothetical protein